MNKLQLYITKSFNGYKVLFNINPSEETGNAVMELRNVVSKVTYDAAEKNIFYLVSSTHGGTMLTIVRTIPSAPVDHLAAWIFIPTEIDIDGETLERVVRVTTRKVSGNSVTQTDVNDLRELFGTEYPTSANKPMLFASNTRGEAAWRRYNADSGVSLAQLLGKGLYQIPYLDYSGVLFVDGDLGITVDGPELTSLPLGDVVSIETPGKSEQGFVAYAFGQPLDVQMAGSLGANLPIVWKRSGFDDVENPQVIVDSPFTPDQPDTSGSRKAISAASFQITGQTSHKPVENCQIMVNGIDVTTTPHSFSQAELSSASVVINCEGHFPYTAHMDLASSTRALVRLQERRKVYSFEMPVKSSDLGAPVRFKIYSKKPLTSSPIDGYELLDDIQEGESRTNHLGYARSQASLVRQAICIAAGLLLGIAIMLCFSKCGGPSEAAAAPSAATTPDSTAAKVSASNSETEAEPPIQVPGNAAATQKAGPVNNITATPEAIAYLDANKTWNKNEMEKHPCLRGLFDDMNNLRIDRLTPAGDWGKKLSASKNFKKLAEYAQNSIQTKKYRKVAEKLGRNVYNAKANDYTISLQGYYNAIDF